MSGFHSGADVVILDLEDAVAVAEKDSARHDVVAALQHEGRVAAAAHCLGYVRVNAADTGFCFRDLTTIAGPWLDGVVLPKVESAEILHSVDWVLGSMEAEQGMERGAIDLIPIIETVRSHPPPHSHPHPSTPTRLHHSNVLSSQLWSSRRLLLCQWSYFFTTDSPGCACCSHRRQRAWPSSSPSRRAASHASAASPSAPAITPSTSPSNGAPRRPS